MRYVVSGTRVASGAIHWVGTKRPSYWVDTKRPSYEEEEDVKVSLVLAPSFEPYQRRNAIRAAESMVRQGQVPWVIPGHKEWTFDLDKLKEFMPDLASIDWFEGIVTIEPEFETIEPWYKKYSLDKPTGFDMHEALVAFYLTPHTIKESVMSFEVPIEIQGSLARFKEDHPDPKKVAFIMMRFVRTKAHDEIVQAIRSVLDAHGITGMRADDKQYHDDLYHNIVTYIYGCGFGIAVFERIETEEVNPNISLEVGYMLGLGKLVCLLKDRTLPTLHTDLVGRLYKAFDPQNPMSTIPTQITIWLSDKGIVKS